MKNFLWVLWNHLSWFMWFFSQNENFYICAAKIFGSNFPIHLQSETFKIYEISVFTRYVWYSTAPSKAHKHFYFILTEKYGSFLTFWAPFQLCATKSRFWGFSQTMLRNHIFDEMHQNAWNPIKSAFLSIVCEEPQKRDLVAQSWKGAQNVRKDPYFSVRIK